MQEAARMTATKTCILENTDLGYALCMLEVNTAAFTVNPAGCKYHCSVN
jgi:hypothetical protein